jgi:hypothetical protein
MDTVHYHVSIEEQIPFRCSTERVKKYLNYYYVMESESAWEERWPTLCPSLINETVEIGIRK